MFIRNLLLTALAVAGLAAAQNNDNDACKAKNNTIEATGDFSKISSCKTLDGDLIIGDAVNLVELSNLEEVKGNFICEGANQLTKISTPQLRIIGGTFKLQGLEKLDTLNMPQLTRVGTIEWITLNSLRQLSLGAKVTEVSTIRISDTALESLEGFDLRTVVRFNLDNNKYLKSVSMGLRNVSDSLSMEFNAKTISISFPELVWAKNITLIDAGSIDLPKLQYVNGSMNIGNNSIESIACKNLTTVEQTLAFIGNSKLTKLDFPELKLIGGGFKIHNNSALVTIDGFPKLETVRGAIDFVGNFKNASLPKLDDVQGGFNLQTTEDFDCTQFNNYESTKVIKGDDYVCKGKQKNPETKDGKSGADDKGGDDSDDDEGAASRVGISTLLGLTMAAVYFAL